MELLSAGSSFMQAAQLAIILSAIPLAASMVVGVLLSVLQAATQVQEQTLTFIPKLMAVIAVFFFFGQWMLQQLVDFATALLKELPSISIL